MTLEEGGGADAAAAGRRKPSWRERENNRRRERRRRAIAAKIYAGLRAQGNFNLPKHCDNNEVLKSLCREAGWIVDEDGTTYRKGCKRPIDMVGTSNDVTPFDSQLQSPMSSIFPSPIPSYQVSPSSSMCPSPSHFPGNPSTAQFPFFYNTLMSSLPPLRISNSCPVTPPPSSPNSRALPPKSVNWESIVQQPATVSSFKYPIFAASAPVSPIRHQHFTPATIPECDESDSSTVDSSHWPSFHTQIPFGVSTSPTFNLMKPVKVMTGNGVDVKGKGLEVDVGKGLDIGLGVNQVKPWEGERISEVGFDDLELTLGSSKAHS
ncbi:unnamed protein product [Rhodiola kirilowii]